MGGHQMAEGEGVGGLKAVVAAATGSRSGVVPVPWWLRLLSLASLASSIIVICSLLLLVVPKSLVTGFPVLRDSKAYLVSKLRYVWLISMEGPFVKLAVRIAKVFGGSSRFSSPPQVPKSLRAKVLSTTDVEIHWTPQLPVNPFHEEHYLCSFSTPEVDSGTEAVIQEAMLYKGDYSTMEGKEGNVGKAARLKWTLSGLPPRTLVRFRLCAVSADGSRSPWTSEVAARSFAVPSKDNGFEGPLLAPLESTSDGRYTWWQTKHEVGLTIAVPEEWKAKDLKVKVTPSRLDIRHNDVDLLRGDFPFKVHHDETDWEIEPAKGSQGRQMTMTLRKEKLMQKWASFLEGSEHHRIDTEMLKLFTEGNAMNEFGSLDLWE